jgi:hypothetical protein
VRDLPQVDFFVIDEFYKLDPSHNDDRASQLNIVFDRLRRTGAQFYLLGPNITGLEQISGDKLRATFVSTGYTTVATDVERVRVGKDDVPGELARVCRQVGAGTLIYCKSPARLREVAGWLLERGVGGGHDLQEAADWIAEAYHPQWMVGRALRAGIGIHHGRLPRALGHHIVRLFNSGRLPYLLVTSTLIEGVNTTARNVIVLDHLIANKKYDYFTFRNIQGRSGRMSEHFVGRVVVFNPEPRPADLNVDIPVLSQSQQVSDEVLLQLPENELTDASRERLRPYVEQDLVRLDTLRSNRGVPPARQMAAARTIADQPRRWARALAWSSAFPTAGQVREISELLFLVTGSSSAVKTAKQLGARVNMLRYQHGDLRELIRQDVSQRGTPPDLAVEDTLDFARNWAQFKIPTALTAVAALAADVLPKTGASASDPRVFAGALENMFLPPFATVLEEYGLPTSTTIKLRRALRLDTARDIDNVLDALRAFARVPQQLSPFEQEMLEDTLASL